MQSLVHGSDVPFRQVSILLGIVGGGVLRVIVNLHCGHDAGREVTGWCGVDIGPSEAGQAAYRSCLKAVIKDLIVVQTNGKGEFIPPTGFKSLVKTSFVPSGAVPDGPFAIRGS